MFGTAWVFEIQLGDSFLDNAPEIRARTVKAQEISGGWHSPPDELFKCQGSEIAKMGRERIRIDVGENGVMAAVEPVEELCNNSLQVWRNKDLHIREGRWAAAGSYATNNNVLGKAVSASLVIALLLGWIR